MPDSANHSPALADLSPEHTRRLTGPDLCAIQHGRVRYTQAGLRFYSDLFRAYGQPLPLPGDEPGYRNALWAIVDRMTAEMAEELVAALPNMAAGEAAVAHAWLSRSPAALAEAASAIEGAQSDQAHLDSHGSNLASLARARLRRQAQ